MTGGDVLDADVDEGNSIINQTGFEAIKESYMDEENDSDNFEEEKIQKNMSHTRIEQDRSQFDAPSMENPDQSYNMEDKLGGNIYNQRRAMPVGGMQQYDSAQGSELISDTPSGDISNQGLIKR